MSVAESGSFAREEDDLQALDDSGSDISISSNLHGYSSGTSSSSYISEAGRMRRRLRSSFPRHSSQAMSLPSSSSQEGSAAAQNEPDDTHSLDSAEVFTNKDHQIEFLKKTLLKYNRQLEYYRNINRDLSKKLDQCKRHGRSIETRLGEVLFDNLMLTNKYKSLKTRFDVPDSPPSDELDTDQGRRAGTPVKGRNKRQNDLPDQQRSSLKRCSISRLKRVPSFEVVQHADSQDVFSLSGASLSSSNLPTSESGQLSVVQGDGSERDDSSPTNNCSLPSNEPQQEEADELEMDQACNHDRSSSCNQSISQHDEKEDEADSSGSEDSARSFLSLLRKRRNATNGTDRAKRRKLSSSDDTTSVKSSSEESIEADFATSPGVIPGTFPAGTKKIKRYWDRGQGRKTSLRSSVRTNYDVDAYFDFHMKGL